MPSERGRLIVEFEIDFPGPEFVTEAVRAQLEKILPAVPEFVLPAGSAANQLAEVKREKNGFDGLFLKKMYISMLPSTMLQEKKSKN